ncbi:MAG: HAD hydrolase-like protein [Clostridia bacterium]|nr:HAD hydrolase-like protein [Clostridia bacterium]
MKYRHFFWDFDGTLFDTYPRITRAFQKGLADAGISASYEELFPEIKVSLAHAAQCFAGDLPFETVLRNYHLHAEEEGFESLIPFPGMREFLTAVRECGGWNYLNTHRGQTAWDALEHFRLMPLFAGGATSLDHFPPKPAPDSLNALCDRYGLNKSECIMLGDRDIDLYACLSAGMAAACIDPDGFCPKGIVPIHASSFSELSQLLLD